MAKSRGQAEEQSGHDFRALQDFFQPDEIEWRLQQAGEKNGRVWAICVPYVTNRAIQQRLDDVIGPAHWRNDFREGPDGGVLCGLSIRVDDEWVTKWDGAENTDIEGVKGGLSGAMKRAAVQWGIGRYLYALEESFAQVNDDGKERGKTKDGKAFRWDPPRLPSWALPPSRAPEAEPSREPAEPAAESKEPAAAKRRVDNEPQAAGAQREQQEAMLEFVRVVGPEVSDEARIEIDDEARNLKEYVRENWPAIKDELRLTRAVVEAIEQATGTPFVREAA